MQLAPNTKLGPYRLIAPIGAGGMGEVWKAHDENLERDVAIKVLPARLASDREARERFEREAKAVAALSHPNILTIYGFGEEGGLHYAVMELLEGQTLRQVVSQGPLPTRKAVEYGRQVAEGLAAAHARGIVHRDLKPENLFVTRDGHVKILDFGLARRSVAPPPGGETHSPTVARHTDPGTVMGTVGYMAPEQVRGEPGDHRTDVFSFGAVLYEMLAGRRAFERATGAETMTAILREDAPALGTSRAAVPSALEQVVEHCLEKRPEDRFQSARDLAFALGASTTASGSTAVGLASRPWRAGRLAAVVAVVAAALGLAYLGFHALGARSGPSDAPRRIAVLPLESSDPAFGFFAEGVGDAIYSQLIRIPGLVVTGRGSSAAFRGPAVDLADVRAKLGVDAVLQGRVTRSDRKVRIAIDLVKTRDGAALWGGSYDGEVEGVASIQDRIVREVAGTLRLALGEPGSGPRATNAEARDLYLRGRAKEGSITREDLMAALSLYEQALERDPRMAEAHAGIAWVWELLADSEMSPAEAYPKAKIAAQKALAIDDSSAEAHAALGIAMAFFDWDLPQAERELRRAVELGPAPERRGQLATVLTLEGRHPEAIAELDDAIALDPLGPVLWWMREFALYQAGRYEDLLTEHARATRAGIATYVYHDSFEGAAYRELGRIDEALASYRRDLAIYGRPMYGLAITYARAGRIAEAREVIAQLEEYRREHYLPVEFLAVAYANVGDLDRAFEWLGRVLETRSVIWYGFSDAADWQGLRRDPRWEALVKRSGLDESRRP